MDLPATRVEFREDVPAPERITELLGFAPGKILVVHDERLSRAPGLRAWSGGPCTRYGVAAGEALKDFDAFPHHLAKISKKLGPFSPRSFAIVAVGGGSVGDFAGFLASVLKRGVPLVHVPSTLLAALDSAHGGKTALNVGGYKNQLGTYYPATAVVVCRSLFRDLPREQLRSAAGEVAKMALLSGGPLFAAAKGTRVDADSIWAMVRPAVEQKLAVVARDPFERGGERQILNFGHTFGHALEAHYGVPHGVAVGYGLVFALEWSAHRGCLENAGELLSWLRSNFDFGGARDFLRGRRPMSRARLRKILGEDKKMTDSAHVTFIFLEDVGRPFRQTVSLESVLVEAGRQGWIRA